jgi:hypothetical protein
VLRVLNLTKIDGQAYWILARNTVDPEAGPVKAVNVANIVCPGATAGLLLKQSPLSLKLGQGLRALVTADFLWQGSPSEQTCSQQQEEYPDDDSRFIRFLAVHQEL